jgi:hypothetical protein
VQRERPVRSGAPTARAWLGFQLGRLALLNKSHQLIFDSWPVTLKIEGSDMDVMSVETHSDIQRLVNFGIEQKSFHFFWLHLRSRVIPNIGIKLIKVLGTK